jgi:hypothetical protein
MKTPSILIVGYGITGKNLHREIAALNPKAYNQLQQPLQKIFVPLTFINVKNLHVKNIMCNFVT